MASLKFFIVAAAVIATFGLVGGVSYSLPTRLLWVVYLAVGFMFIWEARHKDVPDRVVVATTLAWPLVVVRMLVRWLARR